MHTLNQMNFIGLDPGQSGGIAILTARGEVVYVVAMPDTERDILLALAPTDGTPSFAVLERVWSSPGWGHVGAFKFGMSYGGLRMALSAVKVPFDEVLPKKWQQVMGVSYPAGKPRDKNVSKRRAQQLFPNLTIKHAIADALLIAEYCRRIRTGTHVQKEESLESHSARQTRQEGQAEW